jgi:mannosyltransferase OCH1-like enzyme
VEEHYGFLLPLFDGYDDVNIKRIDMVRYLYLHHYGGVYMDMDFTCLKPFGSEFDIPNTFFVANHLLKGQKVEAANAFMAASSPGLSFLDQVFKALPGSKKEHVLKATGPVFLTKQINKYNITAGNTSIVTLPMERIYCRLYNQVPCNSMTQCASMCPNSLTVSFWTHSWGAKGMKNREWKNEKVLDPSTTKWNDTDPLPVCVYLDGGVCC